jgi:hypothetical protein
MTSRERVTRAIHFQGPDCLPHFLPDGRHTTRSVLTEMLVAALRRRLLQPWR